MSKHIISKYKNSQIMNSVSYSWKMFAVSSFCPVVSQDDSLLNLQA